MATKNKNIKTYDLESVFNEYMITISRDLEEKRTAITEQIAELNADIENKTNELNELKQSLKGKQNARLDSRKSTDLKIRLENLQEAVKNLNVMTDEEKAQTEKDLKAAQKAYDKANSKFENHLGKDSNLTEEEHKVWDAEYEKLEAARKTEWEKVETLTSTLEQDKANREELQAKTEEIASLKVTIQEIVDAENKKYNTQQTQIDEKFRAEFVDAQAVSKTIKEMKASVAELETELNSLPTKAKGDLESFTAFLEENKLSTIQAEELFKHFNNQEKLEKFSYEDFNMRKMHPKRDYVIKKVVIPTAITSAAIGASIGAIAGSGLVGGSTVLGFIPVSGTPGLTEMATTMTGAVAGLAATPAVIKTKNLITKNYYKLKSQSAAKNVEDYNDGTDIANLRAAKLMAQIQETQHSILSSKGPKGLVLKVVNRNRIHQIVDYTIDLYKIYQEVESDKSIDVKLKADTLKPIYEMLTNVEEFITNDISEEITHSMLTCKEGKKDHSHKYMIENVDIYARLKITLDKIARVNAEQNNMNEQLKNAKKATKDLDQKKQEAYKLVCGAKPITDVLNFDNKYAKYVATPSQGIAVMKTVLTDEDKKVSLTLANGKSVSLPASEIDTSKKISTIKIGKSKTTITYNDGSTKEIAKKVKIVPEIETARIALADKLINDPAFVEELKAEGYKTITINKLIEKINEWRSHTDEKFAVSGKIKTLYTYAIDKINTETELVQTV